MSHLEINLAAIKENINRAAINSGRDPREIRLIAVTKTVDIRTIQEALAAGVEDLGENRVQELVKKYEVIGDSARWHLIGHLQSNKVKYVVDKVHMIHSLDSISLAREIEKRAQKAGQRVQVLVQVNVAEEKSKFGLKVEEVIPFLRTVSHFEHLQVKGLMTIAPFVEDPEEVRPVFRRMRTLAHEITELNMDNIEMKYLSMGMTNDYMVAIEEGANLVRIGTALFGARPTNKEVLE